MARITLLLPYHWEAARGGAEYQAHLLADYLQREQGHEVTYLARFVAEDNHAYSYNVKGFRGPDLPGGLVWGYAPDSLALYRALRESRPDVIVHMVAGAYTGIAAAYARRHGCTFCWYLASDMDVEWPPNVGITSPLRIVDQQLFRFGSHRAHTIIAQTQAQAQRLQQNFGRPADLVIGNFLPAPIQPIIKRASFSVAWIANVKQLKRPDLFIELATLLAAHPEIHFRMAGRLSETTFEPMIRNAQKTLANFTYLGELSLEGVEVELSQAHLLVNTSDYEGFPNVFIQAWLRKTPVFTLNVDPDGIMNTRSIGKRTGSMDQLVQALREAVAQPTEVAQMGERAQAYALEHHSMVNAETIAKFLKAQRGDKP